MFIKLYFTALPVFFAIDMLWLGVLAKNFYKKQVGALMRPDINWFAGVSFYLLFIVALVVFVITPAVETHSLSHALVFGAFFGFISYATYDLTNLATLRGWNLTVTLVDMTWGTVLGALVSSVTFYLAGIIG